MKKVFFVIFWGILSIPMLAQKNEVSTIRYFIETFQNMNKKLPDRKEVFLLKIGIWNNNIKYYTVTSISSLTGLSSIADYDLDLETGNVINCKLKKRNYFNFIEIDNIPIIVTDYCDSLLYEQITSITSDCNYILKNINDDFMLGSQPILIILQLNQTTFSLFFNCSENVPSFFLPYDRPNNERYTKTYSIKHILDDMIKYEINDTVIQCTW